MCRRLQDIGLVAISLAVAGVLWGYSDDYQRRPKTGALLPSPWSTYSSGLIYYVATTGSDANPGTETQPFRTLSHGVSILTPGDTLYVKSGTYPEALLDSIPSGTSWDSPVTVAAAPGHSVTLKPNSWAEWVLHFQGPQQYIVIDGLVLDAANVAYDAVKITAAGATGLAAHHIRLIRSEVKNAPRQGILVTSSSSNFNEFIALNVHDNGWSHWSHGFYVSTSHNVIEGSDIHHNAGYGVHIYEENATRRADNNIVRSNRIFENGVVRGAGIILGSGDGNTAYNNLVWGNSDGGIKVAYINPSNTAVYNNTVYANSTYGLYVHSDSSNAIIKNNLVYRNGPPEIQNYGVGTILDHNLSGIDPKFINAAGADFRLQPSSPAINGGIRVETVTKDYAGMRRPQGLSYDIGAFEFADSSP